MLDSTLALVDLGEHRLRDLSRAETVFGLTDEGLAHEFPPLRTLDIVAHNLPVLATSFVGRDRELELLGELLRRDRLPR